MQREYKISLSQEYYSDVVYLSQYDDDYDVIFHVINKYSAADVGGKSAKFTGTRTDGLGFTFNAVAVGSSVSFHINTSLTACAGTHTAEIIFYSNDGLYFGSANVQVIVEKAAHPDGTIDADEEQLRELAEQVQEIVDTAAAEVKGEAEAWAVGERDGEPVPSTDPTYHNNAKYYSEVAQDIADSIGIDATLSISGKAADAKKTGDEISSLKEEINALESDVCADFGYTVTANLTYTSRDVPNHDGTFFHDTGATQKWFGSGYVKIPTGVKYIKYRGINYSASVVTPIAFYDANKVFISAETKYTTYVVVEDTIAVPENAKYFYQSMFYYDGDSRNSDNYTIYDYGQTYDLATMKQSTDALGMVAVKYGSEAYTSADIYQADGTKKTFSGWYSTDFIKCTGRNSIQYDAMSYYDNRGTLVDVAYISFFDESKQFIGCLKSSDTTNGEQFGSTNLPSGCAYVRGVTSGSIEPFIILDATGMINDIDASNSLTNGMKICCVGDSLTKGVDVGNHVIRENYPYFMSHYLNCDIVNYGESGQTSKSWWNNYKDVHLFDPTMDIVLIMFGTNGGLNTNTLATDVEPYDDWADYADTSVGDYCKLIEKIMEDTQNHAQIILMTPPYSTYTEAQEQLVINSNPVVKAIAQRYSIPVIDVLYESGMGKFNASVFRPHDGCHFNAKGYHRLGTFVGSKVKAVVSTFSLDDEYEDETPIT